MLSDTIFWCLKKRDTYVHPANVHNGIIDNRYIRGDGIHTIHHRNRVRVCSLTIWPATAKILRYYMEGRPHDFDSGDMPKFLGMPKKLRLVPIGATKKFKYRFFKCILSRFFLFLPPFGGLGPRLTMCVKRQKAFRFPNFSSVAGSYEAIND